MITWHFIETEWDFEENGRKGSFRYDSMIVSDSLITPLRAFNLLRNVRFTKIERLTPSTEVHFDLPGMYAMGQPLTLIGIDGLLLSVPSSDVRSMWNLLKSAPTEQIGDVPLYSLGGYLRWLVLTPDERDRMVSVLEAAMPGADENAKQFWANRESPAALLRRANAAAHGVDEKDLPELGGRTMEEFK